MSWQSHFWRTLATVFADCVDRPVGAYWVTLLVFHHILPSVWQALDRPCSSFFHFSRQKALPRFDPIPFEWHENWWKKFARTKFGLQEDLFSCDRSPLERVSTSWWMWTQMETPETETTETFEQFGTKILSNLNQDHVNFNLLTCQLLQMWHVTTKPGTHLLYTGQQIISLIPYYEALTCWSTFVIS